MAKNDSRQAAAPANEDIHILCYDSHPQVYRSITGDTDQSQILEWLHGKTPLPSSMVESKQVKATKACRYCGEKIQFAAVKCRYCGEFLEENPQAVSGNRIKGDRNVGGNLNTGGGDAVFGNQDNSSHQSDNNKLDGLSGDNTSLIKVWQKIKQLF
ncbi:MAG: hypothetical protein AAF485_11930 [Chloroflexota bacterium]